MNLKRTLRTLVSAPEHTEEIYVNNISDENIRRIMDTTPYRYDIVAPSFYGPGKHTVKKIIIHGARFQTT